MTMLGLPFRLKRAFLEWFDLGPGRDRMPANVEHVYRVPPLTEEYVAAIRLIAPQCDYPPEEKYRDEWERIQNEACWTEFRALQPVLAGLPKPRRVLEIGPGLGRSLVFFSRKLDWSEAELHAYEGDGTATKYTKLGPRFEDSFCGNIALLRQSLEFNGLRHVQIHDAYQGRLAALPGPFDVIYSFYSIGFHWSLEHFLDDILALLSDRGTAIFIVPSSFLDFPQLKALHFKKIPLYPTERKEKNRHHLLLVRKMPF